LLARHGYGVLLYDARGRGESEGSPNGFGWKWTKDISGALDFLHARDDVDPRRIGALGLSTGGDVLIEAAARRRDIHALVTDGAAAGSFADVQRAFGTDAGTPVAWLHFAALRVLTGDAPGTRLADSMPRIDAPVLLVSAGAAAERDFNVLYDHVGGSGVQHWNLPDAHHTQAIHEHRDEYEQRVTEFFDGALT
jgi:pimeloyl-ACP methyl ester carboxylesterase